MISRATVYCKRTRATKWQEAYTPAMKYSDLLAVVYKRLAEEWGLAASWDECQAYGNSVKDWPAFSDSVAALAYLKKHYKLIILSNIDNASFAPSNQRLQVMFDAIYTAQDVGSYKPSDRNFDYMIAKLQSLGIAKSEILHTAESLFHDHAPANKHGLASCWIYRRHDQQGFGATMNPGVHPSTIFASTAWPIWSQRIGRKWSDDLQKRPIRGTRSSRFLTNIEVCCSEF